MKKLMELLCQGVTAAHTIQYMKESLLNRGYEELFLEDAWNIKEGGRYYVNLYNTNGLAFCVGNDVKEQLSFRIGMAHSDYPCFQIKPEMNLSGKKVTKWNVELYGGMYQKSWMDRPLGVAGKVIVKGSNVFHPNVLLYKSETALAIIPSLAIHMDRELNKKGALDVAKELVPIAALSEGIDLLDEIAKTLCIKKEEIIDFDLYLYNMDRPTLVGLDQSMLSSPRLDNLSSVGALLSVFADNIKVPKHTIDMVAVFDNEEVGSLSKQGADSELLAFVLEKVGTALQPDFHLNRVVTESFLLSMDVAHGNHPNYEEKSDATSKAYLGKGFSIKKSVGQKYGTTAESCAVVKQLCEKNQIPYTIAINKTGIPGGSTLGPIVSSHLPVPCADIGMPILAMHSATELGAVSDYMALCSVTKAFFEITDV
ncbi:MAG: M18 family aminopeptidase [Lachnospiraceae bacterium]